MTKHELCKQAAATIRAQFERIEQLENERLVLDKAIDLTSDLVEHEKISSVKAFDKLAELRGQTLEQLVTLDKAIELTKESGFNLELGRLSDEHSSANGDPLTSWLLDDN